MSDISAHIEAILFHKGEPVTRKSLAEILSRAPADIDAGIVALRDRLEHMESGVRLMEHEGSVMLATAPELSALIEGIVKEELSRDLGRAASETLAIVLYLGPVTRARIDWIRGVNATFILRNLMVRGLVERVSNPDDERSFLYRPTFELLAHLGVSRVEDISDYAVVRAEIAEFEKTHEKTEGTQQTEEENT